MGSDPELVGVADGSCGLMILSVNPGAVVD